MVYLQELFQAALRTSPDDGCVALINKDGGITLCGCREGTRMFTIACVNEHMSGSRMCVPCLERLVSGGATCSACIDAGVPGVRVHVVQPPADERDEVPASVARRRARTGGDTDDDSWFRGTSG